VLGLTTAMLRTGTVVVLNHLSGIDLDGLAQGQTRRVFAISAEAALAEARRLTAPARDRRLTAAGALPDDQKLSAGGSVPDPRAPG